MISTIDSLKRPSVYQFRVGDATVTHILEGFVSRTDMHPFVATNATAGAVEELAKSYRLPFPSMEHSFVASLIQINNKLVAVDPGFGDSAPMPTAGLFSQGLALAGFAAGDIDVVAISHCHPDHIGHLMTQRQPTFANADIMIGRREFEYWKAGNNISDMRVATQAMFEKVVLPLEGQIQLLEPGDSITPGLTTVEAFGHSAGHFCFHLESNNRELMLLNDLVPHYVASFAHPEWHFLMDDNAEDAASTRQRILDRVVSDDIPVTGFHIPFPAVGYVEQRERGFEFRPASYQFNLDQQ